ncbi:MAG: hypothetical protein V4555_09865 [Acidobacteriota bacterium]
MRKLILTLLLFQASFLLADKPRPNPADYTVTVHVTSSSTRDFFQRIVATINRQQFEMDGVDRGILALGNYQARQIPNRAAPKTSSGHDMFFPDYEFLFSDGSTRRYQVISVGTSQSWGSDATNP